MPSVSRLAHTDKYDRAIYVSRYFMSVVVLCLLLVEHHQLGAFSLLGLEVGFCLLQGNACSLTFDRMRPSLKH